MRGSLEGKLDLRGPSRRTALGGLFAGGYALAAGPANAQAIVTDEAGLRIEEAHFEGDGGYNLPYYLAAPEGDGPYPCVIVVNEVFGIHAYIKDVCRRLAREGYVALAPDYFDRAGDPATLSDFAQIAPIVSATGQAQVLADTEGAVQHLRRQRFASRQRIGITGICWGGSIVWLAAARVGGLRAGVAWYGRLTPRRPGDFGYEANAIGPIDIVSELAVPVLGLYAQNDQGIPLESVDAMRQSLALSGNASGSEIVVYPGTSHGFHADYRPGYNETAARDGWSRMLGWFRANDVA
jgi:carboxymethylenebutenolidase